MDIVTRTLIDGLSNLRTIILNMDNPDRWLEAAVEALSRIFMAQVTEQIYKISPETYPKRSNEFKTIQGEMNQSVPSRIKARNHPNVAKIETDLWLNLANEVERILWSKNQ